MENCPKGTATLFVGVQFSALRVGAETGKFADNWIMDHRSPYYRTPPLNEVSIGLQFEPLERLKIPHFGLFWDLIRKDFPVVEHAPPILSRKPDVGEWPLPRVWLIDDSDTQLVQLQADRINFNWRHQEGADPYPRFHAIAPRFFHLLGEFERFLAQAEIGIVLPTVAELTYINIFERGKEWNDAQGLAGVFKDFAWAKEKPRFLPHPTNLVWGATFALPNEQGTLNARTQEGRRVTDKERVLQLELAANYPVQNISVEALKPWYELAHEWIVKGFDDLTQPEAQKTFWGKEE